MYFDEAWYPLDPGLNSCYDKTQLTLVLHPRLELVKNTVDWTVKIINPKDQASHDFGNVPFRKKKNSKYADFASSAAFIKSATIMSIFP